MSTLHRFHVIALLAVVAVLGGCAETFAVLAVGPLNVAKRSVDQQIAENYTMRDTARKELAAAIAAAEPAALEAAVRKHHQFSCELMEFRKAINDAAKKQQAWAYTFEAECLVGEEPDRCCGYYGFSRTYEQCVTDFRSAESWVFKAGSASPPLQKADLRLGKELVQAARSALPKLAKSCKANG